ncbi:ATP-binding protein [Rathayibacter soli]|uniref:ATP-binding protein n=1 Tax=Rathayibacter soli TaxID=3144168 RepID=UPI0027E5507F|nr:ATP-binding protein [Glaciibacter superstes]
MATEVAAHGMAGAALETTYLENLGDGGVDAGLHGALGTEWIPAGESAWQFKAGDLPPAECKTELRGANRAKEILAAGGSYRLVLGATRTSQMIASRRAALVEVARELGVADPESKILVIAADALARWIETYPALAASPLFGGIGRGVLTFDEWSGSHPHNTTWTSSPGRDAEIEGLRNSIESTASFASRIEGVSGLGKSRMVLEAMRSQTYEALVVYSPAADHFPLDVLIQLRSQGRVAVVVIDECDRNEHEVFASALAAVDSRIHVVTIGEPAAGSTRSPIFDLSDFTDEAMQEMLRANRPSLSPEAERVVVQIAAGNIDYALKLAQVAVDRGPGAAGAFITEDDLRAFFVQELPEGQLFLASCALALFSRFGVDGDVGEELDKIAAGVGLSPDDLRGALVELERLGLLSRQGRYRTVSPHPVAIFLAAKGWQQFGEVIITDLLQTIDADLAERLFRRAADIGELEAGSPAMEAVLGTGGPLNSLSSMVEGNNASLLVHFAVLSPELLTDHLAELIADASEAELQRTLGIRRDLVWSLEKLAWHSSTFSTAADALLRLAIAENESYSNNASGTWTEFFGTMLPATAAPPTLRMGYLEAYAASSDPRVRLLVARAAGGALDPHESIMISGEVQGGVVVEPRGRPDSWPEVWAYRNSAIDILAHLTVDVDPGVAEEAQKRLIGSIHGLLEYDINRSHLGQAVGQLSPEVVARTRIEVDGLRTLFARADVQDARPSDLAEFEALLPVETPGERLIVLANTRTWDREAADVVPELIEVAQQVDPHNPLEALVGLLESSPELPAAFAIGRAIGSLDIDRGIRLRALGKFAGLPNGEALIAYLHSLVDAGDSEAFDRYLDETSLPALVILQYSARGARTPAAIARVERYINQVTVAEAARLLSYWLHDAEQAEAARYLSQWNTRIQSQTDYNAAIDFAAMQVFRKEGQLPDLDRAVAELVARRTEFPNVGNESYDWSVLVARQVEANPLGVAQLIADLIDVGALSAFAGSTEVGLLQDAVRLGGEPAWVDLMDRLDKGQWRLSVSIDNWLGNALSVEIAERWVGASVERARALAGVTKPGGRPLSPVARFLIDKYGNDPQVESRLRGQFISGMWTGNISDHLGRQIADVRSWLSEPKQSRAVRLWARTLVTGLEEGRQQALLEEEEQGL